MADHDDDVVVVAASFLYFLMKITSMKKTEYPRRFWMHDTLHYKQVIHKFVNIKLTMDVVGHVLLCALEEA